MQGIIQKGVQPMKTFKLIASITITIYTNVEAETLSDAIFIAANRDVMQIPTNIGEDKNEEWVADELDGMPEDLRENK